MSRAGGGKRCATDSVSASDLKRSAAVPRAVFFDIGDTLVRRPTVGPGRRIAEALGLPLERAGEIGRLVFCEPFESPAALAARLRRDLGLTRSPESVIATIWRAQEEEPVEVEGATACVAAVRAAGARVGIISNIWAPYEDGFRRACPAIVPLIESWHLSYRYGAAKPDPGIFRAALTALAVPASRAVMVGDSLEKDVVPALALGMEAVWVLPKETAGANARDRECAAATRGLEAPPPGCRLAHGLGEVQKMVLSVLGVGGAGKSRPEPLGSTLR